MSACCGEGECASKERGVCEDKKVLIRDGGGGGKVGCYQHGDTCY